MKLPCNLHSSFTHNLLNPESMTKAIIKIMNYGGCSPKHTTTDKRIVGYLYVFFTGLTVILLLLKFFFTPSKSLTNILEDCIMLFGFVQMSAKYFTSVHKAHVLSDMLDSLYRDFWFIETQNEDDRQVLLTRYRIAKFLSDVYGIVVMIAVSLFVLQAIIKGDKSLIMDIWIPHKHILKTTPYYQIAFLFEAFLFLSSVYFCVIPLDRIFILLTCFICAQFQMIQKKIIGVRGCKSKADNFNILRACIMHNNVVLKFINNFDSVYSRLFLPTVGTNFILITITMYGLIVEETLNRKLTNLFIYISVTGQLFAYCLAGQLIQDEGLKLGEAAYQCEWYAPVADGRSVSMIIMRSQRKIELTVGGLMVLSMESFATVVRATFSFLTFIVNARTQQNQP